jgi:hypothetical protein
MVAIPTIGSSSDYRTATSPPNAHLAVGFNVEDVRFGGCNWTLWEVGGGYKIRELAHHCETISIRAAVLLSDLPIPFVHQMFRIVVA